MLKDQFLDWKKKSSFAVYKTSDKTMTLMLLKITYWAVIVKGKSM